MFLPFHVRLSGKMTPRLKGRAAGLIALTLAVVVMCVSFMTGPFLSGASGKATVVKKKIGPGVVYKKIRDRRGPWRIHVISIDLRARSTLDVALAGNKLPGFERTSSMARRNQAIAAINGDFARPSGRPVFAFAEDGAFAQTPLAWGRNFAVNAAETRAWIAHPQVKTWMRTTEGQTKGIDLVNAGDPRRSQMAEFTGDGGREERPPRNACSARLRPIGSARTRLPEPGVKRPYRVQAVHCGEKRLARKGGVVLSARHGEGRAQDVQELVLGQSLDLNWSLGWPGVLDTIGGNPTLIEDGRIVRENVNPGYSHPFFARHPRSGVGVTRDGRVLLVVVDGRRPGYSVGMTLREFAGLFKRLGATAALNFDGGGSTTMVVNGKVVNRPSEGRERGVANALLVLRGPDRRQPSDPDPAPTPSPEPTILPTPLPTIPPDAAAVRTGPDPASTGGMISAYLKQGRHAPASLRRLARAFNRR